MGWLAGLTAGIEAFREIFRWKTGGRTQEQNKLRDEMEHWREEYTKAIKHGDTQHASFALTQLRRLRNQAASGG